MSETYIGLEGIFERGNIINRNSDAIQYVFFHHIHNATLWHIFGYIFSILKYSVSGFYSPVLVYLV